MDANEQVIEMIFQKTLKENPRITTKGLGGKGGKKVQERERKLLESSFREFMMALNYLGALPRLDVYKKSCESHATDLLRYYDQSISPGTIALAGRALGIKVRNFQGTKIGMFDRTKKNILQELAEQK